MRPATAFDIPVGASLSDGIGGGSDPPRHVEFSGSNGVQIQGTSSASIEVTYTLDMHTFSNSNTAFPTCNGDEASIRLGKATTIDTNFEAGEYPGIGSRNFLNDGHFTSVTLTTAPAP